MLWCSCYCKMVGEFVKVLERCGGVMKCPCHCKMGGEFVKELGWLENVFVFLLL